MKQPNPERLVVTEGIPITVHSAKGGGREGGGERKREGRRRGGKEGKKQIMLLIAP